MSETEEEQGSQALALAAAGTWPGRGRRPSSFLSVEDISPSGSAIDSESETTSVAGDDSLVDQPSHGPKRRMAGRRGKESKSYRKTGKVTFTTTYSREERKLDVHILRAFDLAKRKDHNNVNPFIRLYLLPGKLQKQHTKVQRKTKEPFFNEKRTFYDLGLKDLESHRLKMKCYNRDSITKNELLGEMDIALSSLNIDVKETFNLDLFSPRDEVSK